MNGAGPVYRFVQSFYAIVCMTLTVFDGGEKIGSGSRSFSAEKEPKRLL
jgi:hypothetical protein